VQEMLFRGRHIYVDDLITDATERSKGHGDLLFDWLVEHARTRAATGWTWIQGYVAGPPTASIFASA
jgi:predicted GNAT superfamily acetyltransferase